MLRIRVASSGWPGGPGLSTFYFTTPLQDVAAAARCVAGVQAMYAGHIRLISPSGVIFQVSNQVDVITAATGAIVDTLIVPVQPPQPAPGGSDFAPPAIAVLVQLRTDTFIAGKRIRGRVFLSPLKATVIGGGGQVDATVQSGTESTWNGMIAALAAGDLYVVWHRPKLGLGGQALPVVSATVPAKFSVLRSRRD